MSASILEREPPPADARVRYGTDPNQFADLRLPVGDGLFAAIIAVHGGYWRERYTLDHLGHFCAALTAAGIATWSIEYRRTGMEGGGWPGTFHDVSAASRELIRHAAILGIDPERIAVTGHSAGGHLASWLASAGRVPQSSPIASEPLPLIAAIPLAGVLDLEAGARDRLGNGAVQDFLGGEPAELPDRYAAASPLALAPSPVPHVAIHGTDDDIVPLRQSRSYVETVRSRGGTATLVTIPNADHFDVIDPESPAWPAILDAIRSALGVDTGLQDHDSSRGR